MYIIFIENKAYKTETGQYISPILYAHFGKSFRTHLSQKKNNNNFKNTSRTEHEMRRAYKFFVMSEHEGKCKTRRRQTHEKITSNC